MISKTKPFFGAVLLGMLVAGCGSSGHSGPSTGPLTLQVVDAPVDPSLIDRVCIPFSAVTLHYAGASQLRLDYRPLTSQVSPETHCTDGWDGSSEVPPVRLDALSGALTVSLVDSLQVPIGRITWIRLHFWDSAYLFDTLGGQHPLACPSCEMTDNNDGRGFKLNRTFEVTANGLALIVDVDLRQSLLHENAIGYVLRPTARVEMTASQGTISGAVSAALVGAFGGNEYNGGDVDTGCAVYVFPDDGSPLDDFHYDESNVVSTATVRYVGATEPHDYAFAAGALPVEDDGSPRSYRIALTCSLDDPLDDDDGSVVAFSSPVTVPVSAGQTTMQNLD